MKKIPDPYLHDIIESIDKIFDYLEEINHQKINFYDDEEKQDAVIRRLEIIGEATKHLESEFKNQFSMIPWKKMAGMRDVLIHDYDQIDLDLIWEVIDQDLPELKKSILALIT